MKKSIFLLWIVLFSFSVNSGELVDLEKIFDFSVTLKDLNSDKKLTRILNDDKFLILEGAVSAINIIENNKTTFKVEVDFVNGEWSGFEDVSMYKSKLLFLDRKFARSFPKRAPRKPTPDYVPLNSHLIVLAKLIEVQSGIPYLECVKFRIIP